MNYYKKDDSIIASDFELDLQKSTKKKYEEFMKPTHEHISYMREQAYAQDIDPLHARKLRKTILGEWTEELEEEYIEQVKVLSESIAERYPYPDEEVK